MISWVTVPSYWDVCQIEHDTYVKLGLEVEDRRGIFLGWLKKKGGGSMGFSGSLGFLAFMLKHLAWIHL